MKKFIDGLRLLPSLPARMRVQPFEWWLGLIGLLFWIGFATWRFTEYDHISATEFAVSLFISAMVGRPLGSEWKPVKWNSTFGVWETE